MRGSIKVGRWLPFRARQVLDPRRGFVWRARAAGLIAGGRRLPGRRRAVGLAAHGAAAPVRGRITGYASFAGLTIPSAGRVGWWYGTDRWAQGEFFRYRITDLRPAGP